MQTVTLAETVLSFVRCVSAVAWASLLASRGADDSSFPFIGYRKCVCAHREITSRCKNAFYMDGVTQL